MTPDEYVKGMIPRQTKIKKYEKEINTMKTYKYATIGGSQRSQTLTLNYCSAPHPFRTGGYGVTVYEFIAASKSARELMTLAEAKGLKLWKPPTEKSEFKLKGERKADGRIHDPVVNIDGKLIRVEIRCEQIPAIAGGGWKPTETILAENYVG